MNLFTVCIFLRLDNDKDPRNHNISVSNNVTYHILSENYSTFTADLASDFLDRVIAVYYSHKCDPKAIPETEISFYIRSKRHNSRTLSQTTKINALL